MDHKAKVFQKSFVVMVLLSFMTVQSVRAESTESKTSGDLLPQSKGVAGQTFVNSDESAYAEMLRLPKDEPLQMLNLIRFNDRANYAKTNSFHAKGWTGEQAYAEYSRVSSPIASREGGTVVYLGKPRLTLIGPESEQWDLVFIVSYPNLASFLALVSDPVYKQHAFHRTAALADSRLIRLSEVTNAAEALEID